jgi:hypothetical protein
MFPWQMMVSIFLCLALIVIAIRADGRDTTFWSKTWMFVFLILGLFEPTMIGAIVSSDQAAAYEGMRIKGAIKACELHPECLQDLLRKYPNETR